MTLTHLLKLSLMSGLVYLSLATTPVIAFDLGDVIEKSFERSVDRRVRKAENEVTNEIDKTIDKAVGSVIPDLSISAKKDDGKKKDISKGIIIFGFVDCPKCQQAYAFMNKRNIRYQLMDPQEDVKAMTMAKQKGLKTVPVIFVSNDRVDGFTEESYTLLFKKHGVIKK
jgi:glutaredoxin